MSPDAMTGMESIAPIRRPRDARDENLRTYLSAWQNWIFQRLNAVGERGALTMYGRPERPEFDWRSDGMSTVEHWRAHSEQRQPERRQEAPARPRGVAAAASLNCGWKEMGPFGFQEDEVLLRTAISVDHEGWAHFEYVKMPDYRWGIFLADQVKDRTIACGDDFGKPVWQQVPGEHRNTLRRLIVTQGDTEPASRRAAAHVASVTQCPSVYDLRNLFQVNVEEGRHLWAMV